MELFIGHLLLSLRLVVPGWAWSLDTGAPAGGGGSGWFRLGRMVAIGLLLNLLPILILSGLGGWTPALDWTVWGLISVLGLIRVFRMSPAVRPACAGGMTALAAVLLLGAVPLLSPPRSEWLAGGWDPGIYQNNAMVIARQNGLQDRTDSIYSAMSPEERDLFAETEGDYREVFPSVPIRLEDGSMPLSFFHLTPVCGAWFLRMGGPGLLFRQPAILAFWSLLPLGALLGLVGLTGWRRWAGLAVWLLSPLWWYQQAIPTSEMLYLLLLLGGLLLYLQSALRRSAIPLGAVAALFAATANHLNFAVLGIGLLLVAAVAEADRGLPGRRARMGACLLAIALGIAWDVLFSGNLVFRLEAKDHALSIILAGFVLGAALCLLLVRRRLPPTIRCWSLRLARAGAVLLAAGVALIVLCLATDASGTLLMKGVRRLPVGGDLFWQVIRMVPFEGVPGFLWACGGLAWLALSCDKRWNLLRAVALALGVVCVFLFLRPGIAPFYPWALRRYLVFLAPLFALAQTFVLVRAVEGLRQGTAKVRMGGLLLLLVPAVIQGAWLSRAAARVGDYPGFGNLLLALEQSVSPGDVVVADDPRWGTPLILAAGRDVINGRLLWQDGDAEVQHRRLEVLRRVAAGRRVVWLTSTDKKLDLYPVVPGTRSGPLAEIPYAYATVIHSLRANAYAVRDQERTLRLYEWDGTASPAVAPVPGAP